MTGKKFCRVLQQWLPNAQFDSDGRTSDGLATVSKDGKDYLKTNKGKVTRNRPTPVAKKNLSKANKGHPPWSTGKHLPDVTKQRISTALKGNVPWNKGKGMAKKAKRTAKRH